MLNPFGTLHNIAFICPCSILPKPLSSTPNQPPPLSPVSEVEVGVQEYWRLGEFKEASLEVWRICHPESRAWTQRGCPQPCCMGKGCESFGYLTLALLECWTSEKPSIWVLERGVVSSFM